MPPPSHRERPHGSEDRLKFPFCQVTIRWLHHVFIVRTSTRDIHPSLLAGFAGARNALFHLDLETFYWQVQWSTAIMTGA